MEGKIRRQVEYYFNDFNLMRDQFMKNEIKLSREAGNEGFISMDIMLKFNRLAQLTTDKEKIAEACANSKLLEINEDKSSLRRKTDRKMPVDDELYRANLKARTCFADKFPRGKEGEEGDTATLDEIYEFLESMDLEAETVAMRKIKSPKGKEPNPLEGKFTGSCFITFASTGDAQKFLGGEQKFREKFELVKMTKNAYWTLQNARANAKKTGENVEEALKAAEKRLESEKPIVYEEGIVLVFSGITDATIKREDIKNYLVEKDGAVEYIDFESGKASGKILLNLKHGKKAVDLIPEGDKINIKGDDITFAAGTQAEFDELVAQHQAFKKRMSQRSDYKNKKGRQQKGRKDRGGRDNNRGGGRDGGRDNNRRTRVPAGKSTKFDSGDEAEPAKEEGEPVEKKAKVEIAPFVETTKAETTKAEE